MTFEKIRAVPPSLVSALAAQDATEHLYEGPVSEKSVIALVDVTRGSTKVTAGAVIEDDGTHAKVARVFDPEKLKNALASLGTDPSTH